MSALKKKAKADEHPLVNHRWQLMSLEDTVDYALGDPWAEGGHPDFSSADGHARLKAALMRFGQDILSRLSFDLEKAASKGINQALALIQDPAYYETVKNRNRRSRARQKEWRERDKKNDAAREKDLERRERCELTEIERLHEMAHVAIQIQYHEKELSKLNQRRNALDKCVPIKEKPRPDTDDEDEPDDDFWPDRISFD